MRSIVLCLSLCPLFLSCSPRGEEALPLALHAQRPLWTLGTSQPARPRAVSIRPAHTRSSRALLEKARALGRARQHLQAVEQLKILLARDPGHAAAWSELSWSAFRAGQLGLAEEAAGQALNLSRSSKLRASAYFSLGRTHETQLRRRAAAEAYRRSFLLRPTQAARRALMRIDRAEGSRLSLLPRRMSGPLTLDRFCALMKEATCALLPPAEHAAAPVLYSCRAQPIPLPRARSPIREAAFWLTACQRERQRVTSYHLAARGPRGHYVGRDLHGSYESPLITQDLAVLSVEARDAAPGGGMELLMRYRAAANEWSWGRRELHEAGVVSFEGRTDVDEYLVVLGVGRSGLPSLTPPILVRTGAALGTGSMLPGEAGAEPVPGEGERGGSALVEAQLVAAGQLRVGTPSVLRALDDEFFRARVSRLEPGTFSLLFR